MVQDSRECAVEPVLVEPTSVDEAVACLSVLWAKGIATTVADTRSPKRPAKQPPKSTAAISLGRLDRLVRVDRDSSALVAEAGASVQAVRDAADAGGLWCPALRWLPGSTPIGAAVAGGHGRRSRRYGALTDYLLGSRFACPSVGLVRHGGMAIKNATGFNLSAAVAGSRGDLGVILEVTLRLVPKPTHRAAGQISFVSDRSALRAARELADTSLEAAAIEVSGSLNGDGTRILLEAEGVAETGVVRDLAALIDRAVTLSGQIERDALWQPYPAPSGAIVRSGVDPVRLTEACLRLGAEARRRGISGWFLAEATGGALEIIVDLASCSVLSELLQSAGVPLRGLPASHPRTLLKQAFDPDDLLSSNESVFGLVG